MKTSLAALTVALVAAQSGIGPKAAAAVAGPTVAVAPSTFGQSQRPGARVTWQVNVRFPARAAGLQINQSGRNLTLGPPQVSCPPTVRCQSGLQGAISVAQLTAMQAGASVTIFETATIDAAGPFSVTVQSLPRSSDATGGGATTISGLAVSPGPPSKPGIPPIPFPWPFGHGSQPTGPPKQPTGPAQPTGPVGQPKQPTGPVGAAPVNPPGPAPPPAGPIVAPSPPLAIAPRPVPPRKPLPPKRPTKPVEGVTVLPDLSPGPYRMGQTVTARFTFTNSGKPQSLRISSQYPSALQVTGFGGDCPSIPCTRRVVSGKPVTVLVYAVIAQPERGAPGVFEETIDYQVGKTSAEASAPGILEPAPPPILTWLALAAGVLAAGAVTALGVRHLQRRWWDDHIVVSVSADPAKAGVESGGVAVDATVRVAVRLEYGAAGPDGPIPVKEITRDG